MPPFEVKSNRLSPQPYWKTSDQHAVGRRHREQVEHDRLQRDHDRAERDERAGEGEDQHEPEHDRRLAVQQRVLVDRLGRVAGDGEGRVRNVARSWPAGCRRAASSARRSTSGRRRLPTRGSSPGRRRETSLTLDARSVSSPAPLASAPSFSAAIACFVGRRIGVRLDRDDRGRHVAVRERVLRCAGS